jgi:NAD(P)-dependent dehydrogenase (short-subunit alcohol dehydrogenase family)
VNEYRYDGRVAIVTGAGRGIGLAHARLLARQGASVVVNDLGGTKEGEGADPEPAKASAAEIVEAGGTAIADTHDISSIDGCEALVAATVKEFSRVDIVINNAGISWWGSFPDVEPDNLERTFRVHVAGSWYTTKAAWPYMVEQGYGRVLMTTSLGLFGFPDNLAYATAKGGVIGLTRSLALNGSAHGITVNALSPGATTRRGKQMDISLYRLGQGGYRLTPEGPPSTSTPNPTEWVSPMVGYLCHESCRVTGEIYGAGHRKFYRMFLATTEGYTSLGPEDPTITDVAEHWDEINAEPGYYVPTSALDWSQHNM